MAGTPSLCTRSPRRFRGQLWNLQEDSTSAADQNAPMQGSIAAGSPVRPLAGAAGARSPLRALAQSPGKQRKIPSATLYYDRGERAASAAAPSRRSPERDVAGQQQLQASAEDAARASPVSLVSLYASCSDSTGGRSSSYISRAMSSRNGGGRHAPTAILAPALGSECRLHRGRAEVSGPPGACHADTSPAADASIAVRRLSFAPAAAEVACSCSPATAVGGGDGAAATAQAARPFLTTPLPPRPLRAGRQPHMAPSLGGSLVVGAPLGTAAARGAAVSWDTSSAPSSPESSRSHPSLHLPFFAAAGGAIRQGSSGSVHTPILGSSYASGSSSGGGGSSGGSGDDSPPPVWTDTRTPRRRCALLSDSESESEAPAGPPPARSGAAQVAAFDLTTPPPPEQGRPAAAATQTPGPQPPACATQPPASGRAVVGPSSGAAASPVSTPPWMSNHKVRVLNSYRHTLCGS